MQPPVKVNLLQSNLSLLYSRQIWRPSFHLQIEQFYNPSSFSKKHPPQLSPLKKWNKGFEEKKHWARFRRDDFLRKCDASVATFFVKFVRIWPHLPKMFSLWTLITKNTEHQIRLRCKVFEISALIGQNLMSKSKWWVLIIACKWVPNVILDFNLCIDRRQCLTDTSNSVLGTFSEYGLIYLECSQIRSLVRQPQSWVTF